MNKIVAEYFPSNKYNLVETKDRQAVKSYIESTASCTWGQAEIPNSGYYKLAHISPINIGRKPSIIICKLNFISAP